MEYPELISTERGSGLRRQGSHTEGRNACEEMSVKCSFSSDGLRFAGPLKGPWVRFTENSFGKGIK